LIQRFGSASSAKEQPCTLADKKLINEQKRNIIPAILLTEFLESGSAVS